MLPRIKKQFTIFNRQKKTIAFIVVFLIAIVFLFVKTNFSLAQTFVETNAPINQDTFGLQGIEQNIAISSEDIRLIIARIIRAFLGLLGIIALVMILYAGYTIMTAGGNDEKLGQGKKILMNTVIGLAIIMSAFIIVSFVINALMDATGEGKGGTTLSKPPEINTFSGSGSLGRIVKDHYPASGEREIARNTSIVVTFAVPTDPSSLIINSNNTCWNTEKTGPTSTCQIVDDEIVNPYYGDCLNTGTDFNLARDCDHLNTSSVKIFQRDDENEKTIETAVFTSYEKDGKPYNYVFKPFDLIGSGTDDVWYEVLLTNAILNEKIAGEDQLGVFSRQFNDFYVWNFETNTTVDLTPPTITGVFPVNKTPKTIEDRNVVVQVYFSEPVDPTVTQGVLGNGSSFYNLIFNTTTIRGEWKLSSGYKVAEFLSDNVCGTNSCGEPMYCLPAFCIGEGCESDYATLARTASLIGGENKWQAWPFTGIYDLKFNALDGNADSVAQGPKLSGDFNLVEDVDKNKDNYYWEYIIRNSINRTPPYIMSITPDVDAENVNEFAPLEMNFNLNMWARSLRDNIIVEEYPANHTYVTETGVKTLDDFGFAVYAGNNEGTESAKAVIKNNRPFGPNGTDLYYFPVVSSSLKNAYQNCFYPGYGPGGVGQTCSMTFKDGVVATQSGCVGVNFNDSTKDTGCMQSDSAYSSLLLQPDTKTCLDTVMKNEDISPITTPST